MTEPIEQLAARVAGLMGLYRERNRWVSDPPPAPLTALNRRGELYEPAEVFRLMCEFNVWPVCDGRNVWVENRFSPKDNPVTRLLIHVEDNTPESRQQAATRAVLMAVELKLKEKQA